MIITNIVFWFSQLKCSYFKGLLIISVAKYIFVCENMLAGPSKYKFLIIRNRVEYIWTSLMVFLAMAKTIQTNKNNIQETNYERTADFYYYPNL